MKTKNPHGGMSATFDRNGCPTDQTLAIVEDWNALDPVGWFTFIESAWSEFGKFKRNRLLVELITGGWSGNESLISSMKKNICWSICWLSSHRGGLHRFAIPESFEDEAAP